MSQEGESPSHVMMEMYLTPWDRLHWEGPEQGDRTELEAGKIIGFQLVVEEFDDRQWGVGFYIISLPWPIGGPIPAGADITGALYEADLFADAELIPCHRGDCSGATTGVSQDSWGRIKASFR